MMIKPKDIRNYIIGLCVIVALIIAIALVKEVPDKELNTSVSPEDNIVFVEGTKITDWKVNDISKVTYTLKDNETVVIELVADEWVINGDEDFPFSQDSFVNQFLQKYVDGQIYDVLEEHKELSSYGLDNPEVTLEVVDKSGNVRTYLVGAHNAVIGAYYMYHKEEDKLYTASSDFVQICREDIYDFAEIDNFPSFTIDYLDHLVMNNSEKKVEMAYFEDGYETDILGSATWYIKSPFTFYRPCDQQRISDNFETLFTGVGFNQKADYYATDEELEAYGLLNSDRYYEIVYRFDAEEEDVSYDRVTVKIYFGNYIEEKDAYYARVVLTQGFDVDTERARSVNLIDRAKADAILNLDPLDYIYPYVLYVPMKEFAGGGITVTKDDGTKVEVEYDAIYTNATDTIPEDEIVKVNGKEVDFDEFKEFYYQFTKIYVNRPIYASDNIVTCEPTYVVNYDRIEEDFYGDAVVEYRVFDSTYYQVTINGEVDALAVRRDVDKAMDMLIELQ